MAKVNICNVEVLGNPASFFDLFKFQITFECHEPLEHDLEWKLVYVSSAYNASLDQTLDSILVGPVPVGRHQFLFEADPPDPKKIPAEDIVGVTVVLIQALYRDKEFIRVGYYVNNEYRKEELRLEPPSEPILEELERHIIASDPRVTRFPIDWGDGLLDGCPEQTEEEEQPEEMEQDNDNEVLIEDDDEDEVEEGGEEETVNGESGHGISNEVDPEEGAASAAAPTPVNNVTPSNPSSIETGIEECSENQPTSNEPCNVLISGKLANPDNLTSACNGSSTVQMPLHQVQTSTVPVDQP